jgi:hypothetical protein
VSGCHAGCRELVGEFAAGGHLRHRRRIWGAMEAYRATSTRTCGPIVQTLSAPAPALSMRAKPCVRWLHAIEKYALEELSNTVLAAEYRTTLPHNRLLAEEIAQTRRQLNLQRQNAFRALPRRRRARHSRSRRALAGHHLIAEGGRRLGGASVQANVDAKGLAAQQMMTHWQANHDAPMSICSQGDPSAGK